MGGARGETSIGFGPVEGPETNLQYFDSKKDGERNTRKPGLKKTDYKLSKVSKFPTTPSCGCAGKVFPSRLCESSKGLHHWTVCKTMVATYCNMEEMPHVG